MVHDSIFKYVPHSWQMLFFCTGRALYLRRQSHRALRKFLREKVQVISSRPFPSVLCKSNTNELWWFSWLLVVFWGNFAANEIFVNFPQTSEPPIVLVYQNYNWYFAVDASELWIQEGKFALLESWERNFERKCAYLHITAKCSSCIVVMHCMSVWLLWMFELIFVLTWNYI